MSFFTQVSKNTWFIIELFFGAHFDLLWQILKGGANATFDNDFDAGYCYDCINDSDIP